MKYFTLKANTKGISNLLILFVFILMSNVSVFGQSAQKLADDSTIEVNSNAKKENAIMIGDCIDADVRGAIDFGMKAILFDEKGIYIDEGLHTINHLLELKKIL